MLHYLCKSRFITLKGRHISSACASSMTPAFEARWRFVPNVLLIP